MKKIYIAAPYFPPSAMPPAQRVRLLVAHLKKFFWEPVVFTVPHHYRDDAEDEWMTTLAGTGYEKVLVPALPRQITRLFGIGDLGLRVFPFLFFYLMFRMLKTKPAVVLYPVPPWYILLMAPVLKFISGVPYVVDFIDPWVEGALPAGAGLKRRISQRIARTFEHWVVKHALVVFSVSDGINNDLVKRHPSLSSKPMFAIPYGTEPSDYGNVVRNPGVKGKDRIFFRYVGAVWDDAYPVLDTLFSVFKKISSSTQLVVEFIGTSYAGAGLAKKQLDPFIEKYGLNSIAHEEPLRVSYKKAVELNLEAEVLFLFGGMQPYYAASKLMGLAASGKPFFAFLHTDSFPAKFLKEIDFPWLACYSSDTGSLPSDCTGELERVIKDIIKNYSNFKPIDFSQPRFRQYTAEGMAEKFVKAIEHELQGQH